MSKKSSQTIAPENSPFNCAQKVFGAFCEDYGIPRLQGIQMTSALGGGLRAGEACGALVGALLVVGLKYGMTDSDDNVRKALCDEKAKEIAFKFREMNEHIACRDLLGIDTSVGDNRLKAKELGLFNDICPQIVKNVVELLEEMGY